MDYQISRTIKQAGSLLAIILIFITGAFAQSNSGTITGQVEHANKAAVPNASVTVTTKTRVRMPHSLHAHRCTRCTACPP